MLTYLDKFVNQWYYLLGDLMGKIINLTGKRFGKLYVIKRGEARGVSGNVHWLCECDCGRTKNVSSRSLRKGSTKSCGCLHKNNFEPTHGKSNTRLYKIWMGMKMRCYNPKNVSYKNYGARGIKVCNEWLNDFENFYNWAIDNGYQDALSIDRIDVNENYTPSNCRWATRLEQNNNSRHNTYLTFNGETKTIKQWSLSTSIKETTIISRLQYGWSVEETLTKPVKRKRTSD